MTAAELIKKLQALPPDAEVVVWDAEFYQFHPCNDATKIKVSVRDNGRDEVVEVWERHNEIYPDDRSIRKFDAIELLSFSTL